MPTPFLTSTDLGVHRPTTNSRFATWKQANGAHHPPAPYHATELSLESNLPMQTRRCFRAPQARVGCMRGLGGTNPQPKHLPPRGRTRQGRCPSGRLVFQSAIASRLPANRLPRRRLPAPGTTDLVCCATVTPAPRCVFC